MEIKRFFLHPAAVVCSLFASLLLFPGFAYGQAPSNPNYVSSGSVSEFSDLATNVSAFGGIVNTASAIVVALAFLYFFWNLGLYILRAGDEQEKAKKGMIWGLIAVVVLTSLWGLIGFIRGVFGFDAGQANNIELPQVDFQ